MLNQKPDLQRRRRFSIPHGCKKMCIEPHSVETFETFKAFTQLPNTRL
ncbi:hypothetical protein SAMN05192544_1001298 [Paraburkholderia hospita]|nr:hypothetical protein SAMN05192544_1001298 [Paraburkholderia hospita]